MSRGGKKLQAVSLDAQYLKRSKRGDVSCVDSDFYSGSILLNYARTASLSEEVNEQRSKQEAKIKKNAKGEGVKCSNFRANRSIEGKQSSRYSELMTFSASCCHEIVLTCAPLLRNESFIYAIIILTHLLTLFPQGFHVVFYDIACRIARFIEELFPQIYKRIGFLG
jgi:hypothetical protein